jgi:hypothetical protein
MRAMCRRYLRGLASCGPFLLYSFFLFLPFLFLILLMVLWGMSGSPEIAFWSTTRHLVRKAAVYAPDAETHKAYRVVLEHAEDRVAYYLNVAISHVARPPTPPAPKTA